MKNLFRALLCVLIATTSSACAVASTGGDFALSAGRLLAGNLIVTDGRASIEPGARISGCIFLTGGTLVMQPGAELWGDLVVTGGTARLLPGAAVRGQVVARAGAVEVDAATRIDGGVSQDLLGWVRASFARYVVLPLAALVVFTAGVLAVANRHHPRAGAAAV